MKAGLIIGLAAIGFIMRSRITPSLDTSRRVTAFARVAGIELTIMAMAERVADGVAHRHGQLPHHPAAAPPAPLAKLPVSAPVRAAGALHASA